MHTITLRKPLAHPWQDMFALVLDIERYPQFVPGCARVQVLQRHHPDNGPIEIVSRMTVGVLPLQIGYTNVTRADRTERWISVDSTDGPMRHLHALWRFDPLDPRSTRVSFGVSYDFRNPVIARLASGAFESMFARIIDAFEHRADRMAAAGRPAHHSTE